MNPGRVQLTPEVVQAVKSTVDIVDVAGDFTQLKRRGRKYEGLCPFHKEKTPSFHVDPDLGLYHCFGCGVGGDAIKMHMELTGDDFPAAIESLAQRYGIQLSYGPAREQQGPDIGSALEAAQSFFRRHLQSSDFARGYLAKRRIPADLIRDYGLGYAPDDWQALHTALRNQLSEEALAAAGLIAWSEKTERFYDRFRHRLMFPIHSVTGKLVGFGGRALGDDRAKYINSAETAAFHKGSLLYGLSQAKRAVRDQGRAVLVEGYFDVIAMVASGVPTAVAAMGTALTPEQAKLIARFADEVVLGYDGDEAGANAATKALPILMGAGLGIKKAAFPSGHDPDSIRLEDGPEAVKQLVEEAQDALWDQIKQLIPDRAELNPRAQQKAATQIRELLQPIRQNLIRAGYARRAAQRLGVPETVFLRRDGVELFSQGMQRRHETRSEEEKAISLLLSPEVPTPPLEELPPPSAFLNLEMRNIFTVFCALYSEGRVPSAREVIQAQEINSEGLDSVARFLLEESIPEESADLLPTLGRLRARWIKQRQAEIQRDIQSAQQQGDQARIDELLEEKAQLSRHRHPQMTGQVWPHRRS